MKQYSNVNFTDCIMNLCFIILGLLYGEGDFEKSILYAVNCGQDTDCTAATVGALLGILKWKANQKLVKFDSIHMKPMQKVYSL